MTDCPLYLNEKEIGRLRWQAEGGAVRFWASCPFEADHIYRVTLEGAGTVYLGRPWRPTGKTTVLDCRLGAHIAPDGFSPWNDRTDTGLASFSEEGSSGAGAAPRPAWVNEPSTADAATLLARARKRCRQEV